MVKGIAVLYDYFLCTLILHYWGLDSHTGPILCAHDRHKNRKVDTISDVYDDMLYKEHSSFVSASGNVLTMIRMVSSHSDPPSSQLEVK